MPLPRHIDVEFTPAALIRRIVDGALQHDPVRLHRAIVAADETHAAETAERDVLTPAKTLAHALDANRSPLRPAETAEAVQAFPLGPDRHRPA
jgi:hypothetical protein